MGVFRVRVTFMNTGKTKRIEVDAIVDTGSTYTKVPGRIARELGLSPERRHRFRLANEDIVERDVAAAHLECEGRGQTVPVAIGGEEDTPILGATALELLGFWVDPIGQLLVPTDGWELALAES